MNAVSIREAKLHLSRLVKKASNGEGFVIEKAGKPLVKVLPIDGCVADKAAKRLGFMLGELVVPGDFDRMGEREIEKLFGQGE